MIARTPRIFAIAACLLIAAGAHAQINEPNAAVLQVQAWNGSSWSSGLDPYPGMTIEWRVVLSYTGTNTSVFALGSVLYQPVFVNADNNPNADGVDVMGAWRNGGQQGNAIPNSMLSMAEGFDGRPLASYGRVTYGATAMQDSTFNTLTTHRHGNGAPQAGAPQGSYLRIAGSSVTNWPAPTLDAAGATVDNLNAINRGVLSNQQSAINPFTNAINTFHVAGTQNLVLFRGAFTLNVWPERLGGTLTIAPGSQARAGGLGSADDTRYISWQTNLFQAGSWRTGFTVQGISFILPSPSALAMCVAGGFFVLRRRR
ncbi:MAG TPA: hypothetical protein VK157_06230 [Phycisphaerales bacterium]|nr:hypothetical protein [Phycisphaerales bacterium]